MIRIDEDALICDLAETYHIYDYRSLPVQLVATLSAGLRDDSRIKMRAGNVPARQELILLATIADRIAAFHYGFSEDASKGRNKPTSIVELIYGEDSRNNSSVVGFSTSEEFEAALSRIRGE